MKNKKNRIHYAWWILIGCCALQGSSLGLMYNCAGLYYAPVCAELGFEVGKFSFYRMLFSISSALVLPAVAHLLRRFDVRVLITGAAAVYGLCGVAMGTFTHLEQWYLAGIVQGAASSFLCFLPAPVLLTNWFRKKTGTAIGISAAFSGLVGMMGSTGLGAAIPLFGWRACYLFTGILSILLILPFSLFVLRYEPGEKGLKAYGEEETPQKEEEETAGGASAPARFYRQPIFYVALAIYASAMGSGFLNTFLTPYGLAVGLSMSLAALLTTLSLFGNMATKLVLGKASDVFGVSPTFLASALISCTGHLLLLLGGTGPVMAGALFCGITLPISSVMLPLFCGQYWKGDEYGRVFSWISMAGTLLAAPANTLFGRLYDVTGGYGATICVSCALMTLTAVLVWTARRRGDKAAAR